MTIGGNRETRSLLHVSLLKLEIQFDQIIISCLNVAKEGIKGGSRPSYWGLHATRRYF